MTAGNGILAKDRTAPWGNWCKDLRRMGSRQRKVERELKGAEGAAVAHHRFTDIGHIEIQQILHIIFGLTDGAEHWVNLIVGAQRIT